MTPNEYYDKVFDYLEELNYPQYVTMYRTEDVARSIGGTIAEFYLLDISWRMCALSIFGLTWEKIKYNINIEHTEIVQ